MNHSPTFHTTIQPDTVPINFFLNYIDSFRIILHFIPSWPKFSLLDLFEISETCKTKTLLLMKFIYLSKLCLSGPNSVLAFTIMRLFQTCLQKAIKFQKIFELEEFSRYTYSQPHLRFISEFYYEPFPKSPVV